jgi:hypothetical protein
MVIRARIEVLTPSRDGCIFELHHALGLLASEINAKAVEDHGGEEDELEFIVTQQNISRREREDTGEIQWHGRVIGVFRTAEFDERKLLKDFSEREVA